MAIVTGLARLLRRSDDPQYPSGLGERLLRKKQKWLIGLFLLFNVIAVTTAVLFGPNAGAPINIVLASIAYITLITWLSNFTSVFRNRGNAVFIYLIISPVFVTITFSSGALEAELAVRSTSNVYRVEIKNSAPTTLILLRSLEKGVLVWDRADNRATLVRWEQIDRISHFVSTAKPSQPLICGIVKALCFEDEPPTP